MFIINCSDCCPMALTAELINSSPSYINQFSERELSLRGRNIVSISNTAATLNYYQSFDLSNNNIQVLSNFSYLDRLKSLTASNNRIKLVMGLPNCLPNLENLFLMDNRIEDFSEIYSLANCKQLKRLVLINNPVTERPNYRLFAIYHIKTLTTLDFRKVSKQERLLAQKVFGQTKKK